MFRNSILGLCAVLDYKLTQGRLACSVRQHLLSYFRRSELDGFR